MNLRQRQQGMTMWSTIFVIAVLSFVVFIIFKLFPPYMDDFKVRNALDGMAKQGDLGAMSREEIITGLSKRFEIDNISHVNPEKDLVIEPRGKMKVIRMYYEVEIPVAGSLYMLLKFNHEKQVRGSE